MVVWVRELMKSAMRVAEAGRARRAGPSNKIVCEFWPGITSAIVIDYPSDAVALKHVRPRIVQGKNASRQDQFIDHDMLVFLQQSTNLQGSEAMGDDAGAGAPGLCGDAIVFLHQPAYLGIETTRSCDMLGAQLSIIEHVGDKPCKHQFRHEGVLPHAPRLHSVQADDYAHCAAFRIGSSM